MAQKQYTTYEADILSFELRDAMLGVLKPGRYIGYDNMTEYQAQVSTTVYCEIGNTNGINKYDQANPPVLEAERGIAITTQGTIIAEDFTTPLQFSITLSASVGIWHLVYLDHIYSAVQGVNNATYGYLSGSDDNIKPSLTLSTQRIILGYVYEAAGATDFSDLTWYPYQAADLFGDGELGEILWGDPEVLSKVSGGNVGTVPAVGVIGDRSYTEQNVVTNLESLTASIDALDQQVQNNEDSIVVLQSTKLDDWATPDDNTDLNASASAHGLLPKLSAAADEFLDGNGAWNNPQGVHFKWTNGTPSNFQDFTDFSSTAGTYDFGALDTLMPSDCYMISVSFEVNASAIRKIGFAPSSNASLRQYFNIPVGYSTHHFLLPIGASQTVYWTINTVGGITDFDFRIIAYHSHEDIGT